MLSGETNSNSQAEWRSPQSARGLHELEKLGFQSRARGDISSVSN